MTDNNLMVPDIDLSNYAQKYASTQKTRGRVNVKYTSVSISRWLKNIRSTYNRISGYISSDTRLPQEFEWMLDNYYLAEREGKEAALSLKKAGAVLGVRDKKKISAVFDLALRLVVSSENTVTLSRVELFLDGAQRERALSEKELSIFVPMLKAALVYAIYAECPRLEIILDGQKSKDENNPFYAERMVQSARESGIAAPSKTVKLARQAVSEHGDISRKLENAFTSLRILGTADLTEVLEESSAVERTLREDPAGIYPMMDDKSRAYYRREISKLAERARITEFEAAKRAKALAMSAEGKFRHVGYYILKSPLGETRKNPAGGAYISVIVLATLFFALFAGFLSGNAVAALLILLPLSEIIKNIADFIVIRTVSPRYVPRIELKDGIPKEYRTLCVISVLLTGAKGQAYANLLEEYKTANRDAGNEITFGILADLPDSKVKDLPEDKKTIDEARAAVKALNEKYGGGYYLFIRERTLNKTDKKYMGWERKRGAITELVRLLRDKKTGVKILEGDSERLADTRYLITLDGDTRLNAGSVCELAGAMIHPVNKAEIDKKRGIVTDGYGLLQPRISPELFAANRSGFSRIFAGQGGIDPYGSLSSDVYHDLFDEASFTGKGIIDVEAFYLCLDKRFKENRVLSHDLLEGGFLRAGLAGDVELTDSYPYKVNSYFERMHRWVRGDWQASYWLCGKIKDASGKLGLNPLSGMMKWKILDNMRRSLVPVFMTAALFCGMFLNHAGFLAAAIAAVISALSSLLLSGTELAFRGGAGLKERYHSTIVAGFKGVVLQTVLQLLFLPYQAVICFSAIVTALYRMIVSKRKLLEWVTADAADALPVTTVFQYYRKMWPAVIIAVIAAVFSESIAGNIAGICWIFAPAIASGLSVPCKKRGELSGTDKEFLRKQAGLIWRYFEDFLTKEDNFLPPDNWQEQPAAGIAHRTSPTNIGLALLCAVSALDLKLAEKDNVLDIIENILNTLKRLPKWNGHLYNWYDTQTLEPLYPRCISTVDSGNMAGCFIALREALREHEDSRAEMLAQTAQKLESEIKFEPLFDKKRRLFYIGFDLETGKPTESYYDLLASEARQTSYIAIARGEIPRRHWSKLGRTLVSSDRYSGMASWTGTMFEYLMPNLLMPCYPNSLIYESAKFCVYEHRRRAAKKEIPWGISESAFYAFDPSLNYQYKAHGVQRLGLKRGLNKELVISPYSSFLALLIEPGIAAANLKRLASLGVSGRYGFYEALDYTPGRLTGGGKFETVRCFMTHHIGMSMLAVNNVLCDGIMQKRFMRDTEMKAFAELIQEKVPVGAAVMNSARREVPEKPKRAGAAGWRQENTGYDIFYPRCVLLSNGSYTTFLTDTGLSFSVSSDIGITKFEPRQHGGVSGMQFFLKTGGRIMSLLPAPLFDENVKYGSVFEGASARITADGYDLRTSVSVKVPENENCELREIVIENCENFPVTVELLCYFEPVLADYRDYAAHPSFSKLSLETDIGGNILTIKRRARGRQKEIFAAFACGGGEVKFDTSREKSLGRLFTGAVHNIFEREPGNTKGPVLDPCVAARINVSLPAKGNVSVRFALGLAEKRTDAQEAVLRVLNLPESRTSRLDGNMRVLGLAPAEISQAFDMLAAMIFITENRRGQSEYIVKNSGGQKELWKFGISGDLPILTVRAADEDSSEKIALIIKQHRFLSLNGAQTDLVFTVTDGGDYRRPVKNMLVEMLKNIDSESRLGVRGGVHIADIGHEGSDDECMIFAMSSLLIMPGGGPEYGRTHRTLRLPPSGKNSGSYRDISVSYLQDGSVEFETGGNLPDSAWCHMLSNGHFGYIATDAGTGHMWYQNARENKINPWKNDPQTTIGAEQLRFCTKDYELSAFAGDGQYTLVRYGFGFARWEKKTGDVYIKTTAYVHYKLPARVFIIETESETGLSLEYFTELLLGADERAKNHVITGFDTETGTITARNPYTPDFAPQEIILCANPEIEEFTCDWAAWLKGERDCETGAGLNPCMGVWLKIPKGKSVSVIVIGRTVNCTGKAVVSELKNPELAYKGLEETKNYWRNLTGRVTVKTPDESFNHYLNGWALYQTQACRMMGRSSVYQCGGAYGFRDQLQDAGALMLQNPGAVRNQLLRAAAHQFEEGDVHHWWHPGMKNGKTGDKGVRTRCSDDLLWLPYTLCEYIEKTGDTGILEIKVPYIKSPVLKDGEHERYETPQISEISGNLFEHSIRALETVLNRGAGKHGLLLIGGGDWNDGLDQIGAAGLGESVWLTWFFILTLDKICKLCEKLGQQEQAVRYAKEMGKYITAANNAWDGNWFLRGYYDDGSTLGSINDEECKIDSIAQSFSALTPGADKEKTAKAMQSVCDILFDRERKIIRLFSPPFEKTSKNPGYIKGYLPGVRENGGQYTHAAIWSALGCLRVGRIEDGYEMLRAILPENHDSGVYKVEPYVIAADVYSNPGHAGRGGWSWYTGAAAWYYRVATEELLGLKIESGKIYLEPKLPGSWNGYEAEIKNPAGTLIVKVIKITDTEKRGAYFDAKPTEQGIDLNSLSGEHVLEYYI